MKLVHKFSLIVLVTFILCLVGLYKGNVLAIQSVSAKLIYKEKWVEISLKRVVLLLPFTITILLLKNYQTIVKSIYTQIAVKWGKLSIGCYYFS